MDIDKTYTAFVGVNLLASRALDEVLAVLKSRFDHDASTLFLTFEDQTRTAARKRALHLAVGSDFVAGVLLTLQAR